MANSHTDPVYKVVWIGSKTYSEFFTASTDGTVSRIHFQPAILEMMVQVLWWDIRKFTCPTERLLLDPYPTEGNVGKVFIYCSLTLIFVFSFPMQAQGATCLDYEVTIPAKFMVGTEQGVQNNGKI